MISESALDIFDALQWMGTAEKVAERYPSTQSTISRTARRCARIFEADISRTSGEYGVHTSTELLLRTRRVHQAVRWNSGKPLRIDAYHYYHSIYFNPWIPGTLYGTFDLLNSHRIADLIRASIVDCWIATGPDVPTGDPDVACIPLAESPLFLYALTNHPLLKTSDQSRSLASLQDFPLITYGRHLMPKTHELLAQHFTTILPSIPRDRFNMAAIIRSIDRNADCIFAATESDFATAPRAGDLLTEPVGVKLDLPLRHCLLVRRHYAHHPRLLHLLNTLRSRVRSAVVLYPSLIPL